MNYTGTVETLSMAFPSPYFLLGNKSSFTIRFVSGRHLAMVVAMELANPLCIVDTSNAG